ncbi:triose-phosphate isomerase [soil metagenome]
MFVAGNWKMHTTLPEAVRLASEVVRATGGASGVTVVLCPPFISIEAVQEMVAGSAVLVGAQDVHSSDEGAYTGAVSAPMLSSVGCHYVIVGHSERREHFGDTDETVGAKVRQVLRHELIPILCVGEKLEERESGAAEGVVERQLRTALADATINEADEIVIAYEPVWAIGTGKTASPADAQAMHAHIRAVLVEVVGAVAENVQILYGGSVKPDNAAELFSQRDINGGLIGGASLKADDFSAIVTAAIQAL